MKRVYRNSTYHSQADPVSDSEFNELMKSCPSVWNARHIAVGVSGGVDSMVLSLLASAWGRRNSIKISAITVDHGLRNEAASEARQVKRWLNTRGMQHHTLTINKSRPQNGIQGVARKWRLTAIDEWCRDRSIQLVLMAHTAEDQAETVWMRILADTGPDGLSAMTHENKIGGLHIGRPLLTIPKARLIATCKKKKQPWIDDPSNQDINFTRVRLRKQAPVLKDFGLGFQEAARISSSMLKARQVIDKYCARFFTLHGGISVTGAAWFDLEAFNKLQSKFSELLLSRTIRVIGGAGLSPRQKRVTRLRSNLCNSSKKSAWTLGGCVIIRSEIGKCWIVRELSYCASPVLIQKNRKMRWDNRFEIFSESDKSRYLRPLGETGWLWLLKNFDAKNSLGWLLNFPYMARLAIPIIEELDGKLLVPHFGKDKIVFDDNDKNRVIINFQPDSDWVYML